MPETSLRISDSKSRFGPQTPEGKARARANLNAPYAPGESGNPEGRPAAGLSIKEQINRMQTWSEQELQRVLDNADAPVNEKAAARTWLHAVSPDRTSAGAPICGGDIDRICDRTIGRAQQSISLNQNIVAFDPARLAQLLMACGVKPEDLPAMPAQAVKQIECEVVE